MSRPDARFDLSVIVWVILKIIFAFGMIIPYYTIILAIACPPIEDSKENLQAIQGDCILHHEIYRQASDDG